MTTFIQILFWLTIPVICIFFRIKKKINTGFTISGMFTSFVVGLVLIGTFMGDPSAKLIEYLNQDQLEEAKKEMMYVLQKNPQDIKNIDKTNIVNIEAFNKIKRELNQEYLDIVNKTIASYKIGEKVECKHKQKRMSEFARLENAERLLKMVESIGEEQIQLFEELGKIMKNGKQEISELEKRCK